MSFGQIASFDEAIGFTRQGAPFARCGTSCKRRNAADGTDGFIREKQAQLQIHKKGAGRFCPLAALGHPCGGTHHGARTALPTTKIVAVKWLNLIEGHSNDGS
ncbi:hypothetical protein SADFL11_00003100 [Roseibium alexandrii DFL-11]|uniref:Uncharacterized protein n=1 Tax=Roseibium alexandrii (strain DSM 17067 / NCIMB 14079 / DFL-11) TaxID=244592 RepID=A0A5E8UWK1_ROSAD|nr:hypothetical protein SADFL11_00003100 [Roseibium alexandrii DFL-11]